MANLTALATVKILDAVNCSLNYSTMLLDYFSCFTIIMSDSVVSIYFCYLITSTNFILYFLIKPGFKIIFTVKIPNYSKAVEMPVLIVISCSTIVIWRHFNLLMTSLDYSAIELLSSFLMSDLDYYLATILIALQPNFHFLKLH